MKSSIIYNSRFNDTKHYKNTEEEQNCKLIHPVQSKINKRSIWHGLLRLQSQTSLADSIILRWEALGITSFCRDILNSRLPRTRERCLVGALMRYVSEAFWISEWKPCLDIYAIQLPCLQPKGDTEHCPVSEIYIAQTCYPEEIKNLLILPLQWA